MNEKELAKCLVRYREKGETEAIARFFEETAHRLWPLALHLSKSPSDADDLLQETYLAAIEAVRRYNPVHSPWGWLTAIMTNKARYHHRRESRVIEPDRLAPRELPEPPDAALSEEERSVLDYTVSKLPELYRQVIELLLRRDMSPAEIARELGRNPGAVRTQLHRCMGLLRRALPSGFAMPAMLVGFEAGGLERVRDQVMAHAEAHATTTLGVSAGLSKFAILTTLLIAGSAAITVPIVTALSTNSRASRGPNEIVELEPLEDLDPEVVRHEVAVAASEESEARFKPEGGQRSALPSGTIPAPAKVVAQKPETPREPPYQPPLPFRVELKHGMGLHIHRFSTGPGRRDVNIDKEGKFLSVRHAISDRVAISPNEPALARLELPTRRDQEYVKFSQDAHLRSIVAVNPDKLQWQRKLALDEDEGFVFALRYEEGMALIAEVNRYRDKRGRQISVLHGLLQPIGSRFLPAETADELHQGIHLDHAAFEEDPIGMALRADQIQQIRPMLLAMQHEQEDPRKSGSTSPLPGIRGVLFREHAGTVSSLGWERWISSFSFDYDAWGQPELTKDWDFRVEGRGIVTTALQPDDLSAKPIDLGKLPLTNPCYPPTPADPARDALFQTVRRLYAGHTYLFHTLDEDTDRWDLVRVLKVHRDEWAIFEWMPIELPLLEQFRVFHGRSIQSALKEGALKARFEAFTKAYLEGDVRARFEALTNTSLEDTLEALGYSQND